MHLQPGNVDRCIMIIMMIMMIIMLMIIGLELVESVESGFGEKKPQIGACEAVGVICEVIAVRFPQRIRHIAQQNLRLFFSRQILPPESTVSPPPWVPPLPPPGRTFPVCAARGPIPAVYASPRFCALTDWSHRLPPRAPPAGRTATAKATPAAPWRVRRIPAGGRARRSRRGREWRARRGARGRKARQDDARSRRRGEKEEERDWR